VLLLRDGLVDKDELEALLDEQRDARPRRISSWRLGEILVEQGRVTEEQVARLVAEQYELPYVELDENTIDLRIASRLPAELVERFTALPTELLDDGSALVAVSDPGTVLFSDELRKALGLPIHFAVASPGALKAAIVVAKSRAPAGVSASGAWPSVTATDLIVSHEEPASPSSAPRPVPAFVPQDTNAWPPLGALLVRDGLVSELELETALAQQRLSSAKRLGEILVERGAVSRADIARVVAEQYELPFLDVAEDEVDPGVASLLPLELAERYGAVPLKLQPDGSLLVAVADPTSILDPAELFSEFDTPLTFAVADPDVIEAAHEARRAVPLTVPPDDDQPAAESEPAPDEEPAAEPATVSDVVHEEQPDEEEPPPSEPEAPESEALGLVRQLVDAAPAEPDEPVAGAEAEDGAEVEDAELGTLVHLDLPALEPAGEGAETAPDDASAPVATELEAFLERGRELRAAAIHFSPRPDGIVVRARVEGELRELGVLHDDEHAPIAPALRSHPDLEVIVLPTPDGLAVTAKLQAEERRPLPSLRDLGLAPADEDALRAALASPTGLVLLAGPTESNVASVASALFAELSGPEVLAFTIEDAIEHRIDGVDQIEASESGLTVAQGLRRIMRAAPDAVLVGETADKGTAELVVGGAEQALIVTTVPAHTAREAVRSLLALGVGPSVLATTLRAVHAQTSVRRICVECRGSYFPNGEELGLLGRDEDEAGRRLLGRGRGCERCGMTGFDGHADLSEVVVASDELREWLADGAPPASPADASVLRDELVRLCLEGVTTTAEVRRVLGSLTPS